MTEKENALLTASVSAIIILVIFAFPVMALWNVLIPHLSNYSIPTINYWESMGLLLLTGFLFRVRS